MLGVLRTATTTTELYHPRDIINYPTRAIGQYHQIFIFLFLMLFLYSNHPLTPKKQQQHETHLGQIIDSYLMI